MTPEAFRAHFPSLGETVHLCSCSQGAQSDRGIDAMAAFMASWRGGGAPWAAWTQEVEKSRLAFARVIGAHPHEVAVVSCASEGASQVASTLPMGPGRRTIVTNDLEFPSVGHVWLAQAEARGGEVRHLPAPGGAVPPGAYEEAIDEATALVSVPLVSYANGVRFPVAEVAAAAHAEGARVFVDAYQGAGVMALDVHALNCDYLVAGALKYLLGVPGIAFLYVREAILEEHRPLHTGWFGRRNPYAFDPRTLDFAPEARRFETGTPAIPAAYAAVAGLSLIEELDMAEVERHVAFLADRLQAGLLALGARLFSPADRRLRGPQVTIHADRADDMAADLATRAIFTSPRGKALRLSLHHYNNVEDVDRALEAVAAWVRNRPFEGGGA